MDPTKSYKPDIIRIIEKYKQIRAKQIREMLNISEQTLFKHLKSLLVEGRITKIGTSPRVFYMINPELESSNEKDIELDNDIKKFIEGNFIIITPSGELKSGISGFVYWCNKTNQPIEKTANDYFETLKRYQAIKKDGLVEATTKLQSSFKQVYLNKLFYVDFYSIERFGKTKLGQLLLYAKQNQDTRLIMTIAVVVKEPIQNLIQKLNIDGIGYIPPTVRREIQFMSELEKDLNLNLSKLQIFKVKGEIAVPQKTLNKLEDRIENAQNTFVVDNSKRFKNILLIDDAVGSGATLNETAKKLRDYNICSGKIIGLSITGSFKGYDVISEV